MSALHCGLLVPFHESKAFAATKQLNTYEKFDNMYKLVLPMKPSLGRLITVTDTVELIQSPATHLRRCNLRRSHATSDIVEPNLVDETIESGEDQAGSSESEAPALSEGQRWSDVKMKLGGILSNAEKHAQGIRRVGHTLGVDVGDARTGVAISLKGYAPRPLSVLHLKGENLVEDLLQIAARERADEFIVGLPTSFDGKENLQSKKTRSFVGRLANQAALRGWRVYLMDEYGSSQEGLGYMLEMGVKKQSRRVQIDAYAALVLLQSYFGSKGDGAKLVVPKGLLRQERLCLGDNTKEDDDFWV